MQSCTARSATSMPSLTKGKLDESSHSLVDNRSSVTHLSQATVEIIDDADYVEGT